MMGEETGEIIVGEIMGECVAGEPTQDDCAD